MSILVTGATGAIGRLIVAQLHLQGHRVRALSREPSKARLPEGVEVKQGSLSTGELARGALDGVRAVFLFPAEGGVDGFLKQAITAGVEHLVVLSSLAAAQEHARDLRSMSARHHLAIEDSARRSGLETTVLRPGTFANNLLAWAHSIKAAGLVAGPYPRSAQAPIHEADIADVAVAALTGSALRGQTLPMTGPEALAREAQLATIGRALGRALTFHETSPETFASSMERFMSPDIVRMLLDYWSDTSTTPDVVRPVDALTGHPGRTLARWAEDHVTDFR
jgi:uncharacterized protein YbjT (DUF2867 family)